MIPPHTGRHLHALTSSYNTPSTPLAAIENFESEPGVSAFSIQHCSSQRHAHDDGRSSGKRVGQWGARRDARVVYLEGDRSAQFPPSPARAFQQATRAAAVLTQCSLTPASPERQQQWRQFSLVTAQPVRFMGCSIAEGSRCGIWGQCCVATRNPCIRSNVWLLATRACSDCIKMLTPFCSVLLSCALR